jgi:hypothetical protein
MLATLLVSMGVVHASAAPASDPAFLGISMDNAPGYCSIGGITPASPAQDAGLMWGDAVTAIDGMSTAGPTPCSTLQDQIVSHRPGDEIQLDVRRGTQRLTIRATLSTRAEVLHRRFVDEPMFHTELADFDNDKLSYDLGARRGRTTIVGWFMLENCIGCARVFDRVLDGLHKRSKDADTAPSVLAVTAPGRRGDLAGLRKTFTTSVSLAMSDMDVFEQIALKDSERISFMVIDCRGVVRFVAPIAPDADDLDAALDDVLAAAEQAEHQRTSRR